MNTDAKLIKAKIGDLFDLCDKHCEAKFSSFLDGGEIALIEDEFRIPYGYNTMLFGGYEDAERKIFGVFPEWQDAEKEAFPLCVIRFDVRAERLIGIAVADKYVMRFAEIDRIVISGRTDL